MSFTLVAHDKLKTSVIESIVSLIKHHKKDHLVDPAKLQDSLPLLPDERRTHADFLLKVASLTDAMDTSSVPAAQKRARILNAAVFYLYDKIEQSYKGTGLSPERSNFYNSLRTSLNIDKDNTPNDIDKKDMYTDLKSFLCMHTYKEGKSEKGYLDLQVFGSVFQYHVVNDIKDLSVQVATLEGSLIEKAETLRIEAQRPVSYGGLFSWLMRSKPVASVVVTEPEKTASMGPR